MNDIVRLAVVVIVPALLVYFASGWLEDEIDDLFTKSVLYVALIFAGALMSARVVGVI